MSIPNPESAVVDSESSPNEKNIGSVYSSPRLDVTLWLGCSCTGKMNQRCSRHISFQRWRLTFCDGSESPFSGLSGRRITPVIFHKSSAVDVGSGTPVTAVVTEGAFDARPLASRAVESSVL